MSNRIVALKETTSGGGFDTICAEVIGMSIKDFAVAFDTKTGLALGEYKTDATTEDAQSKAHGICSYGSECSGGGGQCSYGSRCGGQ